MAHFKLLWTLFLMSVLICRYVLFYVHYCNFTVLFFLSFYASVRPHCRQRHWETVFSICPVINGVGERHVSLFFSWKPQARSRRSCTVPIRQIFTEWLTFLCFNLITLFWVGRNSNDVTWCDRAFYAKIHNFRPSISLYLWNANRNSHTSLQDLQIVSGSLSEKNTAYICTI